MTDRHSQDSRGRPKYPPRKGQSDPRGPGGPGGPSGPTKPPRSKYTWVFFLMLCVMLFTMATNFTERADEISFAEFRRAVENAQVQDVVISDDKLTGTRIDETSVGKDPDISPKFQVLLNTMAAQQEDVPTLLEKNGVDYKYAQPSGVWQFVRLMLPWLLIFAVMYFFVFRQFRGMGGGGMLGNFGRSRHRVSSRDQVKYTFEDVAGVDEAKEELQEVIQFLRSPKQCQRLGGRTPRGMLLVGEPGCGKTLLAKAIAGEADVPFFSISGSDFVEMFVGVGASRVRDLFKQAKENSPCIIFLDEIDAVGRRRGANIAGSGHDEREQTLNAILVEMDGFSTDDQVIVLAATNRADILDHALMRPGRFDRQIYVPLPDIKGRYEILKVHARKVKLGPDADLQRLARGTPMYSGADLEAIINEAALAATIADKEYVEMSDFEEARDKVRWGRARRRRVIDEKEKIVTAYHESGHALVQSLIEDADPLHKVSIIPRGHMGGATFSLPEKDRTMYTRRYCLALIRICLGGRVAEEMFCQEVSSGAAADIQQATEIARNMIMVWGMSEKLGFVHYGGQEGLKAPGIIAVNADYSEHTAQIIDNEIKEMIDQARGAVNKLLDEHRQQLELLKDALLKYETLDGEEVRQIISGKQLDKPTVGDLLAAEQRRSNAAADESASDVEPPTEESPDQPQPSNLPPTGADSN